MFKCFTSVLRMSRLNTFSWTTISIGRIRTDTDTKPITSALSPCQIDPNTRRINIIWTTKYKMSTSIASSRIITQIPLLSPWSIFSEISIIPTPDVSMETKPMLRCFLIRYDGDILSTFSAGESTKSDTVTISKTLRILPFYIVTKSWNNPSSYGISAKSKTKLP